MLKNTWFVLGASTAIFVAGFSLGSLRQAGSVAHAQAGSTSTSCAPTPRRTASSAN